MRYQVLKNSVPVAVFSSWAEAEEMAVNYDADEIREIEDDEVEDFR